LDSCDEFAESLFSPLQLCLVKNKRSVKSELYIHTLRNFFVDFLKTGFLCTLILLNGVHDEILFEKTGKNQCILSGFFRLEPET